jgi:hypothetical protein
MLSAPYRRRERLRPADVNFSVALSFGVLVARGEISPESLSAAALEESRDAILAVADRVTVEQDPALTAQVGGLGDVGIDVIRYLSANRGALGARGEVLARQVGAAESGDDYRPTLDEADFSKFEMRFPAHVTLVTRSGEEFTAEQSVPFGGAGRPLHEVAAGVREKFLTNARPHLGARAEHALETVLAFDGARDVRDVVAAVTAR